MRSNNVKLHFLGYIALRTDTKEYLSEIVIDNKAAIIAWTTANNYAYLFKLKEDAESVIIILSIGGNIEFELQQMFKFTDNSANNANHQQDFTNVAKRYKLVSF